MNDSIAEAAHTPGPWTTNLEGDREGGVAIERDGYRVATVHLRLDDREGAERAANACLIVAAEDLLAAVSHLERAIDGFTRGEDYYVRDHGLALSLARADARAAIAKAKGGQ